MTGVIITDGSKISKGIRVENCVEISGFMAQFLQLAGVKLAEYVYDGSKTRKN